MASISKIDHFPTGEVHVVFSDGSGILFNNLAELDKYVQEAITHPGLDKALALNYALAISPELKEQELAEIIGDEVQLDTNISLAPGRLKGNA